MYKLSIHQKIFRGDVAALRTLLRKENHPHNELLLDALMCTNIEVIQLLLDHGYAANTIDDKGISALHIACRNLNAEAAKLLIKYGAKPSCETADGLRPIHLLASAFRSWCLETTTESSDDCYVVGGSGDVRENTFQILQELFKCGEYLSARKRSHRAIVKHFMPMATKKMLTLFAESGFDLKYVDRANGCITLLHQAVHHGNVEATKELLRHIDINAESGIGAPIHVAAFFGQEKCAALLIKSGCNVDHVSTSTGDTPLYRAFMTSTDGSERVLRKLISHRSGVTSLLYNNMLLECLASNSPADLELRDSRKLFVLTQHLIKMAAAGFSIEENLISTLEGNERVQNRLIRTNFKKSCECEIDSLRRLKICGDFSMFDLLKKHESYTCWYMNRHVVDYFEARIHESQFPLYCDSLYIAYKRASIRRKLVHQTEQSLSLLFAPFHVPYPAMRVIINCLSLDDLNSAGNI